MGVGCAPFSTIKHLMVLQPSAHSESGEDPMSPSLNYRILVNIEIVTGVSLNVIKPFTFAHEDRHRHRHRHRFRHRHRYLQAANQACRLKGCTDPANLTLDLPQFFFF